jgi:hypothetical protein
MGQTPTELPADSAAKILIRTNQIYFPSGKVNPLLVSRSSLRFAFNTKPTVPQPCEWRPKEGGVASNLVGARELIRQRVSGLPIRLQEVAYKGREGKGRKNDENKFQIPPLYRRDLIRNSE